MGKGKNFIDRLLVPTAVSLTTVVFALLILQRLLLQQQAEVQSATRAQVQIVKDTLESGLSSTILPLELLRERWTASSQLDFPHMESDAGLAMSGYPGYQAIEWVDPSLHVRWAVPRHGNETDIGASQSVELRRLETFDAAESTGKTMATRVVNLRQGGRGVLVCVPVFRDEKLTGFLVGVFRLQDLLGSILKEVGPNYWLSVSDGDEQIYTRDGATPPRREEPAQAEAIQFAQLQWRTEVWPNPEKEEGNERSILPQVTFVGGLVLAAWLAVTAYMAEASRIRAKELATANKELQREIAGREHAEEALREAQKMEAVGRLAGGVAHDFNNMLMVIRSQAELSFKNLSAGDPLRGELDEIVRTSDRASKLTRQLLAFGRKQMLKPQVLNLNTLVAQVAALLPPVLGVDIKLNLELDDELGLVKADFSQLEQVLMNLVFNARDAMPGRGELTIHTENRTLDEAWVTAHGGKTGPHVMLLVTDTGCGMSGEILSHIFEPFFTTKDRTKGTGLGLASAYGTVHQSGGSITISSKVGSGTTVEIYLPQVEGVAETSKESDTQPTSLQGAETILVVEDDDAVRRMTRRLLLVNGFQVVEARGAAEAFDFMERHSDSVDLVLTDLSMPGMKGQELGERLARAHADVRLLYMSAYTEDSLQVNGGLRAGAAFIEKPFGPDELARKVREVLGTKTGKARAGSICPD